MKHFGVLFCRVLVCMTCFRTQDGDDDDDDVFGNILRLDECYQLGQCRLRDRCYF